MGWFYLFLAIVFELAGTTTMKFSESFTRLYPSIMMFVFYGCSLTSLTHAVKTIDIGIAYAIWSGLGTALIALIGFYIFNEKVTMLKIVSISIIIIGVIGLNIGDYAQKH
ncbi:DMT family transporter [Paenibacillus thermotolerans]|uniref:DMT family transporter n=1 Tax=Paenibacillus thermotolerans TaxID=3027807 RepID=UPI0023685B10|nr:MULTISPECIES: multidrug efflux SMR transporter [unclassified Paenibacillus]